MYARLKDSLKHIDVEQLPFVISLRRCLVFVKTEHHHSPVWDLFVGAVTTINDQGLRDLRTCTKFDKGSPVSCHGLH